jgi:hypothetical protein
MPRKARTAHGELDLLRQTVATERVRARDLDAALEAAKQRVEDISDDLTEAFAEDDTKLIQQRRQDLQAAEEEVKDLTHRSRAPAFAWSAANAPSTTSPASVPRIFWRSVRSLPERWLYNSHVQAMSWSGHITPSPRCGWRSTGWSQPPRTPLSAAMDLPPHTHGNRSCGISNAPSVRPPRWNHHCRAGPAWPTGSDATAPTVCCSYADASDCLNPNRTSLIG